MTLSLTSSLPPHLTNSLFLKRLICYLMPYFAPVTNNMDRAEADIIETLASYGARTRAEFLNVVQIIACSMSGLELLTLAKVDTTLSASQQIRLRGCANNLNRSAHQAEKALTARLKCDLPTQPEIPAEPVNDVTPAQTEEILHRIDAQLAAARAAVHPANRGKASAMFNTLFAEITSPPPHPAPRDRPPADNRPA
jgi:hypothetical protein